VKKGVMIAIGIVAIAIAGTVFGLTANTEKETKSTLNSTNVISVPPLTHGKNYSVNLAESVGVGAH
jgi:hypothetical protein